jgi:4-amino-4-deoxy-L-arabinose transferase-like glycosyltransferase
MPQDGQSGASPSSVRSITSAVSSGRRQQKQPPSMISSPIFWLIAGTTLLRVAFAATTGLGVDESYMVTAGRVLSLGYFDHPPASWWLSWGAAHLFGTDAPWAVRLPFVSLSALSQVLIWRITCLVANRRAGFWAVVAFNLSPVFSVTTGTWVLPDGPLDTALAGAVLCLLHALPATGRTSPYPSATGRTAPIPSVGESPAATVLAPKWAALPWWTASGFCAGLATFSKYSAVLTIAGALVFLLISRPHRHWLRRPEPYIAVAVAVGVFSPVLIWNATHGWASFAFQGQRAAGLRFRPWMPIQTLAGEALFVLPWVWVPMMVLFVQGLGRKALWPQRLLSCLAAPPIVVFAMISAWSSQRILYHWAAPGYLMLFPPLGDAIARRLDRAWVRGLLAGSAALMLIALAIISTQLQFDWLGGRLVTVLRSDPTPEGIDWTSIREDLRARGLLPPGALVAAVNWRDAGKIGYALGPEAIMLCLNADARQFGFARPLHDYAGRNILVLTVGPAGPAARWFNSIRDLPDTYVRLNGRVLRSISVSRGDGLRDAPRQP